MAKKSKVPLVLRASFTSTTAEQTAGEQLAVDLSAYVDALSGKVLKINNVWFGIDDGSAEAVGAADYEGSSPTGTMQLCSGTQTSVKAMSDDRVIAQSQFYYQAVDINGASTGPTWFSILPAPEMGFFVAADSVTFMNELSHNTFDSDTRFLCVFEAQRVKLSASDVNFLLINQTRTG